MEPTNTIIQLEDPEGNARGLYLTTRRNVKDFQQDFESALKAAKELLKKDEEGWGIQDYLDEILAKEFDLWREHADLVQLEIS